MKKNLTFIIAIIAASSLMGLGLAQAKEPENDFKGKGHSPRMEFNIPRDISINLSMASREDETALKNESNLQAIKNKGANLIDSRIRTLNREKESINKSKLSAEQKALLVTMIDENINGLTTLKTKLTAETDLAAAKADVSSMFTDYRIYGVLIPKLNALRTIYLSSNNLDKIQNTTFVNYQTKIDALKTSNGDTALIAKMEANLAKAKTEATATRSLINSTLTQAQNLKPADYPTTSRTTLINIKNNLNKIHKSFKTIKLDLGIKNRVIIMEK